MKITADLLRKWRHQGKDADLRACITGDEWEDLCQLALERLEYVGDEWKRRFEWLADKVIAPDYGDNDSNPHRKGYLLDHCKGSYIIYGDSLVAAVDEMIELEKRHP